MSSYRPSSPGNLMANARIERKYSNNPEAVCIATVILSCLFLVVGTSRVIAQDWYVETVDTDGDVGFYTSIAVDDVGLPCISYCNDSDGDLKFAYYDGSEWHIETADASGVTGLYTSLEVDVSGNPHISYNRSSSDDLKYAYKNAEGWHTETVDPAVTGEYTSLALDSMGYPHISYYEVYQGSYTYDLKYAYKDETGWHTETFDSEGDVGRWTSIDLDDDDYPHISYQDFTPNYDLKYAYRDAAGWHIEIVEASGNAGLYSSIALDGFGYPHISYVDAYPNNDLKYAYKDVSGWHIETPDGGDISKYTSLFLDGDNGAHISYREDSNTALKYAYRDDRGWQTEMVDEDGNTGMFNSLILDGEGIPHISYQDNSPNLDLKYARMTTSSIIPLIGSLNGGQIVLEWSSVLGAVEYWVYGTTNLPWFAPGMDPGYEFRLDILPNTTTTWSSTNGIGDYNNNWTYLIMAVDASEAELARSNRFGEFDYEGDIP